MLENTKEENQENVSFPTMSKEDQLLALIHTRDHLRESAEFYEKMADPETEVKMKFKCFPEGENYGFGGGFKFGKDAKEKTEADGLPEVIQNYKVQNESLRTFFREMALSSNETANQIDSIIKADYLK